MVFIAIGLVMALGVKNVKEHFYAAKRDLEVVSGAAFVIFLARYVI